jgi:hypothetical protein
MPWPISSVLRVGQALRLGACLNNLALLYLQRGSLDEAEPVFRELADLSASVLGEADPRFATTLVNLGCFYRVAGRLEHGAAAANSTARGRGRTSRAR